MKNLRCGEVKWLAQGHTLLMTGWKNNSGWDCFAFVPLSPVEAAKQKTGPEDQISAAKTSEGRGPTTEDTGSQGNGRVLVGQGVHAGTCFPSVTRSKLLNGQSCPMRGPYIILRGTGGNCRGPFHELLLRGSWNSNRGTSQPLKMDTCWQKMKLQDAEAMETVLFGGLPSPFSPHIPITRPSMSHLECGKKLVSPLLHIISGAMVEMLVFSLQRPTEKRIQIPKGNMISMEVRNSEWEL